jgi:hypothetical protein
MEWLVSGRRRIWRSKSGNWLPLWAPTLGFHSVQRVGTFLCDDGAADIRPNSNDH